MGSKSITTTTYECDFKCGATRDIENVNTTGPTQLNHARVPQGWEKLYRVPTAYMTTNDDSAKVPYVVCPKCYRIFEVLAMGDKTGVGARFREFVKAFWANEEVLEAMVNKKQAGKPIDPFEDDDEDPFS